MKQEKELYQQLLPLVEMDDANFSNFYVCKANQLAYQILRDVKGLKKRRILIYSSFASGKTHLLKASYREYRDLPAVYINLKSTSLTESLKAKIFKIEPEILIIDQIEKLKIDSTPFFISLFERYLINDKTLILGGRYKAKELDKLTPHIKSRLQNCLQIKIDKYSEQDILNIMKSYAKRINLEIPERYLNYILKRSSLDLHYLTSLIQEINICIMLNKKLNFSLLRKLINPDL